MIYKKNITLLAFPMSDFIMYEGLPGVRQSGFNVKDAGIPITEFTKEEAEQYGEFLKWTFIARWKEANGLF